MSPANNIKDRTIAILVADGVNDHLLNLTKQELESQGAITRFVAPQPGSITDAENSSITVDYPIHAAASNTFDALYIPGGKRNIQALVAEKEVLDFVCSIYSAGKHIAIDDDAISILEAACLNWKLSSLSHQELRTNGIFLNTHAAPIVKHFIKALANDHPLPDFQNEKPTKDLLHALSAS